jgi:hypothetical protein
MALAPISTTPNPSHQYLFAHAVEIKPSVKDLFTKIINGQNSWHLAPDFL